MLKFFLRNHDWVNGIAEARDSLLAGKHRNDVIEQAINAIEDDRSIETVGPGGFPNFAGEMELDGAGKAQQNLLLQMVSRLAIF
ncbi:MAG: isoaspartyl peptidase/L-asparaginase [Candidatus Obscuribacter sp.]|nr:isoaspartyl peptidase/L-asparaginase [Candidatus Obscuribacter sp.]